MPLREDTYAEHRRTAAHGRRPLDRAALGRAELMPGAEEDVSDDGGVAGSRATGGDPEKSDGDAASTTGSGRSEGFVGRVSGQDEGYSGLTGAEAREQADGD